MQRLLLATGGEQRRSHLAKHINVGAPETVDGLSVVADGSQVAFSTHQQVNKLMLNRINVLNLIYDQVDLRLGQLRSFRSIVEPTERVYLEELMATADALEGLQALVEKREPIWGHS